MPTIFYAWQSDSPNNTNRGFIRGALDTAAQLVGADLNIEESLDIDQDTQGVPGSPEVARTILGKISQCEVFVGDLTFVGRADAKENSSEKPKLLPNSNVLLELGYALAVRTDARVITVMNTHYGPPQSLPFDLAHRRHPIKYSLSPDASLDEKKRVREELTKTLRQHIRWVLESDAKETLDVKENNQAGQNIFSGEALSLSILKTGEQRFTARVKESGITLPTHGTFEVGLAIFGTSEFHPDRAFLNLITQSNPNKQDWPLWFNPTLINDEAVKPKPKNDNWETLLVLLDNEKWSAPSIDFWLASPLGRFYHRRGLWEDHLWPISAYKPYASRAVLNISLQIKFVADALVTGQAFAKAMGAVDGSPHLDFAFRWIGLQNRVLHSLLLQRLFVEQLRATDNEKTIACYLPLAAGRQEIVDRVFDIIRPLCNLFDGFTLEKEIVAQEVSNHLDSIASHR